MVILLNFAPIDFMGGAEKWMNDTAKELAKRERTFIVSVDRKIANHYGKVILKREFSKRAKKEELHKDNLTLTFGTFIPFSKKWKKARHLFKKARLIYTKYEILELCIIVYFGGLGSVRKTVAGIHSPFLYSHPQTFIDSVHNTIYGSIVNKVVLAKTKAVHVLNNRDKQLMLNDLHLTNVELVPNSILLNSKRYKNHNSKKTLNILFVGELSTRKGIDIFIDTIRKSPEHFHFTMAGDGEKYNAIKSIGDTYKNCTYKGYLNRKEIEEVYEENDILFLPSRAESMSLVILEALSHGLVIVDSEEISLKLQKDIEFSRQNKAASYLPIFNKLYRKKLSGTLDRKYIKAYCRNNFSTPVSYI